MRWLLIFTALWTHNAVAIEPSLEVGFGGGALVPFSDTELRPGWLIAPRLGLWFDGRIGFEAQVGLAGARARTSNNPYLAESAHLSLAVDLLADLPETPVHVLLRAGAGVLHVGGGADRLTAAGTAGTALLVPIVGPVALRVDVGAVMFGSGNNGITTALETHAGIVVRIGLQRDRDHDGLLDRHDACPTEMEDLDNFEDDDGCPDPDNDNDGVLDVLDGCPTVSESFDGIEDADGCPELDRDGDGVRGKRDRCPNEPEDFDGIEDHDGCPEECMALLPPEQGGDPDNLDGCSPDF